MHPVMLSNNRYTILHSNNTQLEFKLLDLYLTSTSTLKPQTYQTKLSTKDLSL